MGFQLRAQIGDNQSGQRERRENGCENADRQGYGKTAHRPRAHAKQDEGGNQRGEVGIENGDKRRPEACLDGIDGAAAGPPFLADAFEHQHVGVNRHAHGENDAGDARNVSVNPKTDMMARSISRLATSARLANRPNRLIDQKHEQQNADKPDDTGYKACSH